MDSFFSRYKSLLVLAAVLLAQIIGLAVQVRRTVAQSGADPKNVRLLRYWVVSAVSPFEKVLLNVGHGTRHAWSSYVDLRHARRENSDLKAELARLRLEQASLAEDARQAHRLQTMLGFQEHYISKTVAAQIIGTSGTDQSRILYIDKGSKDGIKPDMPVITPDGIVGKVRDVFPTVSQVLQISDQTAGAGVVLETTRIRGILRGNAAGQLQIIGLLPDDRIQPGETVVTSGGDQIFPRGLPVGQVTGVVKDRERDPYIDVLVRPAANLAQLEEVLIITQITSRQPDINSKDAADNLPTQRASDVLSEKLPSIHEPGEAPVTIPQKEAGPNSVAPPVKPPQPLHPDRFSGAPPAATAQAPTQPPASTRPLSGDQPPPRT